MRTTVSILREQYSQAYFTVASKNPENDYPLQDLHGLPAEKGFQGCGHRLHLGIAVFLPLDQRLAGEVESVAAGQRGHEASLVGLVVQDERLLGLGQGERTPGVGLGQPWQLGPLCFVGHGQHRLALRALVIDGCADTAHEFAFRHQRRPRNGLRLVPAQVPGGVECQQPIIE